MDTKRHRSSMKCNQCRIHKCKCLPEDRVWDDQEKRKCVRCDRGGHECGPRTRLDVKAAAASATRQSKRKRLDELVYSTGNSHQHDEGALFLASEGPRLRERSVLVEKTPCRINDRMIELGMLRECTLYLEFQNDEVELVGKSASTLPNRKSDHLAEITFTGVQSTIAQILHDAHLKYGELCRFIIEMVEWKSRDDPGEMLSHFIQLKDHLEAFQSIIRFRNVQEDLSLNGLRIKVREKLIPLYERKGDAPMVDRLKGEIRKLPTIAFQVSRRPQSESHLPDIGEFDGLSRRIYQTLSGLIENLPAEAKKHLPRLSFNLISPIHEALRLGQIEAACSMAKTQDLGDKKFDLLHRQVIHFAAELADPKLLSIVLDRSPKLREERDSFDRKPLYIAAFHGRLDACKLLVEAEAHLASKDIFQRSILCVASGAGHLDVVKYLLDKTLHLNEEPHVYCSPLYAAVRGDHADIVGILVHHGANPECNCGHGNETPIRLAELKDSKAILDIFRAHLEHRKIDLEEMMNLDYQSWLAPDQS